MIAYGAAAPGLHTNRGRKGGFALGVNMLLFGADEASASKLRASLSLEKP